jgi:hypothetical protein
MTICKRIGYQQGRKTNRNRPTTQQINNSEFSHKKPQGELYKNHTNHIKKAKG